MKIKMKPHIYKYILIAMAVLIGFTIWNIIGMKVSMLMYADSEWYTPEDIAQELKWLEIYTEMSIEWIFILFGIAILVYIVEFVLIYIINYILKNLKEKYKPKQETDVIAVNTITDDEEFCRSCGTKIKKLSTYCPLCGIKINN